MQYHKRANQLSDRGTDIIATGNPKKELKLSPLDGLHRTAGAKMGGFAGYDMPIHYHLGILKEHEHTRTKVGLFDVSHMGQLHLTGKNPSKILESVVCSDIEELKEGKVRYTMLTNEAGGIIDDILVSKFQNQLFIVVNASRKSLDFQIINSALTGSHQIEFETNRALIAIQGPYAKEVLGRFCSEVSKMPYMTFLELYINGVLCRVSRSGYTGEDGYEISLPMDAVESITKLFLAEKEVELCGLGARDTLRLEAGYCLYGNDINETITPIEANLGWVINNRRMLDKTFPGAEKIVNQHLKGTKKTRVGLLSNDRSIPRAGTQITNKSGQLIGQVTSGSYAPSLATSIGMGYVFSNQSEAGNSVDLLVRGKKLGAKIVKLPFISKSKNLKPGVSSI